jgi:hypothetical protein
MARIDIDLLRYGSRGAVYRVTYDGRMLIAESRVPACDAARGWAGIFQNAGLMRTTGASSTTMLLHVTLRLRRCDARQQDLTTRIFRRPLGFPRCVANCGAWICPTPPPAVRYSERG